MTPAGPLSGPEVADAIQRTSQVLASQPDRFDAASLLAALLQRYEIGDAADIAPRGLEAAFAFANVDRQALCEGALQLLKGRKPLADMLAVGRADGWDAAADRLIRKGMPLLRDTLFAAALTHGIVTDVELEFLLTALRRQLLLSPKRLARRQVTAFACVLVRQCLNNEYVFFADRDELAELDALERDIEAMLAGDAAAGREFLRWSLYHPPHETPGLEARAVDEVRPEGLRALLADEFEARRIEAAHAGGLTELSGPADDTSRRVADQYRSAPYPRWLSLQAPREDSARDRLRGHFPEDALGVIKGRCDILIAGAGTGRQAVDAAIGYGPQARVLAVDLSPPSLAYGARMAERLGVRNLRFATGDLLRLDPSAGPFDVIECVGVLHHLADPFAGWRALIDRLRPGGLMLIGLYSATARQDIEALTEDRDWPGPDSDDDGLRAYRRALMAGQGPEDGFALTRSPDFFTKSGFRDLVLHVSERRCRIPEIRDFLADNALDFHGFSVPDAVSRAYADAFPGDAPPGTLDNWHAFEQANPRTFSSMYQFWCRRPN